jgi:hypothetical protein
MYRKIKIFIYTIGFILLGYCYFNEGLEVSHTPPTPIIFSIVLLIFSSSWINIDFILSHLLSVYKTTYKEHLITIFANLTFIVILLF